MFKIKYNADGIVECCKAHLVAKGYIQPEGIDFTDTFSPVAKLNSVKLLLSLADVFDWSITQLDISNAFLNGDLDEEIYMKLPLGTHLERGTFLLMLFASLKNPFMVSSKLLDSGS